MTAIFGYASCFSVADGERIGFHVSAEGVDRYTAQLVRLEHGFDGPGGPGFVEHEVTSACDGAYEGRTHRAHAGSSVLVADPEGLLEASEGLALGTCVYATGGAAEQCLLGVWSCERRLGWALMLLDGRLALRLGDGHADAELILEEPLPLHAWCALSAGWSRAEGEMWLEQSPLRAAGDRMLPAAERRRAARARATVDLRPGYDDAPFRIAAASLRDGAHWHGAAHFNGKLEDPWVSSRRGDRETTARWGFGASPRPDGLLLDDVLDLGAGLHGRTVNQPQRAVTSSTWGGEEENYRAAPEQYAAIHFHDDDVEDLEWPEAFGFTVPKDLRSGVYAMRLRGDGAEEHVPFFVRARPGARARVAVLFPTGSYLAYANDRLPFDAAGAELLIGHVPVLHDDDVELQRHYDFGHSCYELHSDGSGVVFSSRRRPIVNMRPRYRGWFMTEGPWQFPADLAIVAWLEHSGIAWDAITDEDLHREGASLLAGYEVVITGSHPEYVSTTELDALEHHVEAGGRLMYLGGNGLYWRVSYHPQKPHLMEVRRSENGSRPHQAWPGEQFHATSGERCGLWRNKGRAPQRLVGVGFAGEGFDRSSPYERLPASEDPRAAFIFEGVGADELIGDFGYAGGGAAGAEIDRYDPELGSPIDALLLASSIDHSDDYQRASEELYETPPTTGATQDPDVRADLVLFWLDGGGAVFSTGSIAWSASLPHDSFENNVARITGNVLRRFLDPAPLG